MRGVYEANIKISALAAAKTLLYITCAANKVIEILSASVTQESGTVNQQLSCCLQKVGTLGTPTGTTLTPTKSEQGDQASGATVVGNVTASEPTYTANTQYGFRGAASLGGWSFEPVPEERNVIAGGDTIGLRMLTPTFTAQDTDVAIRWREIG